jgi:Zn-dependent peptidase ImmA (M78 family)
MFALFPEILHVTEKGDPEALALLVRKYFGENQIYAPRLRVGDFYRNAGIDLSFEEIPGYARLDAWDSKGQYFVQCRLNPRFPNPREQNYALAHLLGHVFFDLHPKMANGELQRSVFEESISPAERFVKSSGPLAKAEMLADAFALNLLLPRGMVKKAVTTLRTFEDAAAFFHVDPAVLIKRLEQLGMKEAAVPEASPAQKPAKREAKLIGAEGKIPPPPMSKSSRPEPATSPMDLMKAASPPSKAAPPPAPKAKAAAPSKPADQSSMTRVARNVAALSYRREDQRSTEDAKSAEGEEPQSKGLDRIRRLAKKIDGSVDV